MAPDGMHTLSRIHRLAATSLAGVLVCLAGCDDAAEDERTQAASTSEPQHDEGSAEAPTPLPPPPPPPASEWLHGEFEFRTAHLGRDVHFGLRFSDGTLARTREGVITASEPYRVVDDAPERVVLELTPDDGPPKARELRFDGPDVLWDTAAPELRFERVHGRAVVEGSGGTPQ